MYYTPQGTIAFYNIFDLMADYFYEMNLKVYNTYLCHADTKKCLMFQGNAIRVPMTPDPIYPMMNTIIYDPTRNISVYPITAALFGLYLDQCKDPDNDDGDILQGYIAHYVEDNADRTKQKVTVKTKGRGEISSEFYSNVFLAYYDCTFRISGHNNFDLKAFDVDTYGKK